MFARIRTPISPLLQFVLLLTPVVVSCFYVVYATVGLVLDGKNKMRWDDEARDVGLGVLGLIAAYCVLSMLIVWLKRGGLKHPVTLSSVAHIVLSLALTALVFAIT